MKDSLMLLATVASLPICGETLATCLQIWRTIHEALIYHAHTIRLKKLGKGMLHI